MSEKRPVNNLDVRRAAFNSLAVFGKIMTDGAFEIRPHIQCAIDLFESAMAKKYRRLLIHMPPGAGKSFLSQLNIAWSYYRNPDAKCIIGSYGLSLSQTFGRSIRNYLESPQFKAIAMPRSLLQKGGGDSKFYTRGQGTFLATSIGGATTGFRAGAWDDSASPGWLVIDDPLKGSTSRAAISAMHTWYSEQASKRVLANNVIAIIATRFHLDDLHGRRIANEGLVEEGGVWKFLRIAALCDDPENDPLGRKEGESFWPDNPIYSVEALMKLKHDEPETFYALYQGVPVQKGGKLIKNIYINRGPLKDQFVDKFISADTAFEEHEFADYSALTLFGVPALPDNKLYVLNQIAGKWDFPQLVEEASNFAKRNEASVLAIENKASGKSLLQSLAKGSNIPLRKLTSSKSKAARAQLALPLLKANRVVFPNEDLPWVQEAIFELTNFPFAPYDDRFDSIIWGILYYIEKYGLDCQTATTFLQTDPRPRAKRSRLKWQT